MSEQRNQLAPYFDKRVQVEGVFERMAHPKTVQAALVHDVVAKVDGRQIHLGHMWIQAAELLRNCDKSQRVSFLACVGKRIQRDGRGKTQVYNLISPTDVKVASPPALRSLPSPKIKVMRTTMLPPSSKLPPPAPICLPDSEKLREEAKTLARKCGGWDRLEALIASVKEWGQQD